MLLGIASCSSKESMPAAVKTADEAKAILPGKLFIAKDVGLLSLSTQGETNLDGPNAIEWFSAAKELEGYQKSTNEKFANASLQLSKDTVANTTGFEFTGNQTYVISDKVEEGTDTPPGIRLELSGASDIFKDMGMTQATMTYYILGASDKKLLLKTPQSIDNRYVVLLMEVK